MLTNTDSPLRRMVYAALFGALTAAGSFLAIPLQPVPITLQTLFTGLAGVLLGGATGALSQIVYVLLGLIGLPVFAGGRAGIGTLFGPSGGYLIGFVVGAYVIGRIAEIKPNAGWAWIAMALVAGNVVIYTLGTVQLALVAHFSWLKAVLVGVVPFLIGDALKLGAATWLALKLRTHITI